MVEVTPLHHPNQILCVIVVKSSYHLDIDRESIYYTVKQGNVRMLTHFLMKESTSNMCVNGRMYLLQMSFLCLVKHL